MGKMLNLLILSASFTLFQSCGKRIEEAKEADTGPREELDDSQTIEQTQRDLLYSAIISDDSNLIDSALIEITTLDFIFKNGETPLTMAIQYSNNEIIEKIIDKTKDLNSKNATDLSPLHLAVKENKLQIVQKLISLQANLEAKDLKGLTPFAYALKLEREDILLELIINGADLTTPLFEQNLGLIFQLKSAGFDTTVDLVELILKHNSVNQNSLIQGISTANTLFVGYLLKNYGDYKQVIQKQNVLNFAMDIEDKEKRINMVNTLLKYGANPNANNLTPPIIYGMIKNQKAVIELLIIYNADILTEDREGLNVLDHGVSNLRTPIINLVFGPIKKAMKYMSPEEYELYEEIFSNACDHLPKDHLDHLSHNQNVRRKRRLRRFLDC